MEEGGWRDYKSGVRMEERQRTEYVEGRRRKREERELRKEETEVGGLRTGSMQYICFIIKKRSHVTL